MKVGNLQNWSPSNPGRLSVGQPARPNRDNLAATGHEPDPEREPDRVARSPAQAMASPNYRLAGNVSVRRTERDLGSRATRQR
jgi:hypothetical protein